MKINKICVYDFETISRNPHTTEPCQLAAVMIDPLSKTIIEGSEFSSLMRVLDVDKIEQGALDVNKKTREEIEAAPHPKTVWQDFISYVKGYTGLGWAGPIAAGHNILRFDEFIVNSLCKQYGPLRDGRANLFNPAYAIDTMQLSYLWMGTKGEISKFNLDEIRNYTGMPKNTIAYAHDALQDVYDTANLVIRYLELFSKIAPRISFRDCFVNA